MKMRGETSKLGCKRVETSKLGWAWDQKQVN